MVFRRFIVEINKLKLMLVISISIITTNDELECGVLLG